MQKLLNKQHELLEKLRASTDKSASDKLYWQLHEVCKQINTLKLTNKNK